MAIRAKERRPRTTFTPDTKPERLPREPLRCCPGEGIRRNGRFCHASRASITPAAPTTLTLPTHDLAAGAAWLHRSLITVRREPLESKGFGAHPDVNSLIFIPVRRPDPARGTTSSRIPGPAVSWQGSNPTVSRRLVPRQGTTRQIPPRFVSRMTPRGNVPTVRRRNRSLTGDVAPESGRGLPLPTPR
jgi:hypothetical protein